MLSVQTFYLSIRSRLTLAIRMSAVSIASSALLLAGLIGSVITATAAQADTNSGSAPNVAATIRPIHSLVASIMQDVGEPYLIFDKADSVHGAVLRPSQVRRLQDADLVIWIGRGIEHELIRPMKAIAATGRLVTLAEEAAIEWRPLVAEDHDDHKDHDDHDDHEDHAKHDEHDDHKDHDDHAKHDEHDDHAGHAHDEGGLDWHVWLDIGNAIAMAHVITERLVAIDPAHAEIYQRNEAVLVAKLTAIDIKMAAQSNGGDYVAQHDAYGYFTHRYGWHSLGSILAGHEISPSIGDVRRYSDLVKDGKVDCLIADARESQSAIDLVRGDSDVPLISLDPVGVTIPPGPAHFGQLMVAIGEGLSGCNK